jgi:hypothetical protein
VTEKEKMEFSPGETEVRENEENCKVQKKLFELNFFFSFAIIATFAIFIYHLQITLHREQSLLFSITLSKQM